MKQINLNHTHLSLILSISLNPWVEAAILDGVHKEYRLYRNIRACVWNYLWKNGDWQ